MERLFFMRVYTFILLIIFSFPMYSEDVPYYLDEDWESLSPNWTDGVITSIVADNSGNLYCGGSFTTINGVSIKRVARWNGTQWQTMGGGFDNGAVEKMAITTVGTIYAVGSFTRSGMTQLNRVAKWNGSSWTAVGSGFNDVVYTVTVRSDGVVFVGGKFTQSGSTAINRIAYWNGSQWVEPYSGVSGGLSPYVLSLTSDSAGNIYVGGQFQYAGAFSASNIAKWDGTQWSSLGSGTNGPVYSLAVDETGKLYVGGNFTRAGGVDVNNIAIWNGSSWSSLMGGANGIIFSIVPQTAQSVFIGGNFSYVGGGVSSNGLAWWYSNNWRSVTSGVSGSNKEIRGLILDTQGNLCVCGDFYMAGGNISYKVARLKRPPVFTLVYTAGIGGRISGNLIQSVMRGNNGTEVIAVPDSGYQFDRWSDGLLSANRVDINVTENKNIVAYFIVLSEGYFEGEGSMEGVSEGSVEGISEGEGFVEGIMEGIPEGVEEGTIEGEGSVEGIPEGVEEGIIEGEGIMEGVLEGNYEGTIEGEGNIEGEMNFRAWIEGDTYIHKVVGETHTFSVSVEGSYGEVFYEWYYCKDFLCLNPLRITNVIGQELSLEDLSIEDSGWYWCQVSDYRDVVETQKVYLYVSYGLSVGIVPFVCIVLVVSFVFTLQRNKMYGKSDKCSY